MATYSFIIFVPLAYLIARYMRVPNMGMAVLVSLLVPLGFLLVTIAGNRGFSPEAAGYITGKCFIAFVSAIVVMILTFRNKSINEIELDEKSTSLLFAIDKKELVNFEKALAAFGDRSVRYILVAGNNNIKHGTDYYLGINNENFGAFDQEKFTRLLHKHYYSHVTFSYIDLNAESELKEHLEQVNTLVENLYV